MKLVKITLALDSPFVRMLNAHIMVDGGWDPKHELDPAGVLARVVCCEARGGLPADLNAITPPMWRPHIDVVHEERRVTELKGVPDASQAEDPHPTGS